MEELRDKIQAGSISNGGYVVDPYKTLNMLNERTKENSEPSDQDLRTVSSDSNQD